MHSFVSRCVACALFAGFPALAFGGDHQPRVLPAYAIQPPGASYENYPAIGREQKVEILKEILHDTATATVCRPIRSTALLARRMSERLAVRGIELLPPVVAGLQRPCGHCRGDDDATGDLGGGAGGPPLPARLTLLPGSEVSTRALLDLIASAQVRIDLMMYGWDNDPTGREVAAALAARARAGVRVRVIVDRTGFLIHNAQAARGCPTFLDALDSVPNVTVIQSSGAFLRFDHRKLAVFDERIAWTGGMILTEVARRRWHNFAYLAEGPIVAQLAAVFAERWHEQGGISEGPCRCLEPAEVAAPNAVVRMVRTDANERSLKEAVYHAVDHARCHIYLENPYFADQILIKKLIAARRRGVDVRAVLCLRGNMRDLNRFETLTANRLLRGGVRVWLYPAMTHVKAMSADGVWAYIGTGNFDELSLRNNREVGLSVVSPSLVTALDSSLFLPDLAVSQELTAPLPPPKDRLKLEALALWY
jgi:cardiolipin synthase